MRKPLARIASMSITLPRSRIYGPAKSSARTLPAPRFTPAFPPVSNSFARRSTQPVMSVSAGPPLGGLYLKPPSAGGLCEGVITMPSAQWAVRPAFSTRIAREITGVGV